MTDPLATVPAEDAALVSALKTHIERERRILQLVAIALAVIVTAMGVGSYLIWANATNPQRILKVVDQEFAHQAREQAKAGKQTMADVCSFLRDNHLKASNAVQRDFKCPLKPHHGGGTGTGPSGSQPGPSGSPGPSGQPGPSSSPGPQPSSGGGHPHNSPPPKGGHKSPSPKPSPTCSVLSLLGKCLVGKVA